MAQVKCKIHKEKSSDVYPDPDFYPSDLGSWISDPGSNNSNKRDKNITKQNQIKPILSQLTQIYNIFYPKELSPSSQKYGLGSGILKSLSRIQK
jgi:hypothetical protein